MIAQRKESLSQEKSKMAVKNEIAFHTHKMNEGKVNFMDIRREYKNCKSKEEEKLKFKLYTIMFSTMYVEFS